MELVVVRGNTMGGNGEAEGLTGGSQSGHKQWCWWGLDSGHYETQALGEGQGTGDTSIDTNNAGGGRVQNVPMVQYSKLSIVQDMAHWHFGILCQCSNVPMVQWSNVTMIEIKISRNQIFAKSYSFMSSGKFALYGDSKFTITLLSGFLLLKIIEFVYCHPLVL